jgi:hypothetical protein
VVPTLRPAVLEVGAWPLDAGPENPRNDRGGGTREPVLLRLRPCIGGREGPGGPRSEKRGTIGGSAAISRWLSV